MARPKNEQLHEQRRAQILRAAAVVFKNKGFHGARTEDICRQAEMSAGAVFRYFADKREMINAIADIEIEHYSAEFKLLLSENGLRNMASMSGAHLEQYFGSTTFGLGLESWLEWMRDSERRPQLLALDAEMRAHFSDVLAHGREEGWARKEMDPKGAANVMFALLNGLWLDHYFEVPLDLDSTAKAIGDFVQVYILNSSAADLA